MGEFEVYVSKADFKFNCAHFISFKGFRERLHGHNYTVSVKVVGEDLLGSDGYVVDFGDIKKATRDICKSMNESFICPKNSTDLTIVETEQQICLQCEDGSTFSFPRSDCVMLPIVHSSAEELSHWMWCALVRKIGLEAMLARHLKVLEVGVAEAPMQLATFRCKIPQSEEELRVVETRSLLRPPVPCQDKD